MTQTFAALMYGPAWINFDPALEGYGEFDAGMPRIS